MRFIPREISGVRILLGCEANILDTSGQIDIPENYLHRLDFVMAGFHEFCGFDSQGVVRNTEAIMHAIRNPEIHAISHPGNPAFPVDYAKIARAASETGTALEINNSSFTLSRPGSRTNCEKLAREIKRFGTLVVVGSDAHISQNVGEFDQSVQTVIEAGIPPELVVNSSLASLLSFLDLPS
jgi:putative hydrolase